MIIITEFLTHNEYDLPIATIWRKGDANDPFIQRTDSLVVVRGVVTLLEIPSRTYGVHIQGMSEVKEGVYRKFNQIKENEFVVDYSVGIVFFNQIHEGKTISVHYEGRGLMLLPATRIYTYDLEDPNALMTLQEYIKSLREIERRIAIKFEEINDAIQKSIETTDAANIAIDNANSAAQTALDAAQTANDVALTSIIIRKDPVSTYNDLFDVYPNPENGWQVVVNDTGDIYRYDGIISHQWQLVGNLLGGYTYASEQSDGVIRKEDYIRMVTRPAFFAIPKVLTPGIQPVGYFVAPSDGKIVSVEAYCTEKGLLNQTVISIDRISDNDYNNDGNWDNIFSQNLIFQPQAFKASGGVVSDFSFLKGDKFRINISQFDASIRGISIIMTVNVAYETLLIGGN